MSVGVYGRRDDRSKDCKTGRPGDCLFDLNAVKKELTNDDSQSEERKG